MAIDTGLLQTGARMVREGVTVGDTLEDMKGIATIGNLQAQTQHTQQATEGQRAANIAQVRSNRDYEREYAAKEAAAKAKAEQEARILQIYGEHPNALTDQTDRTAMLTKLYATDPQLAMKQSKDFSERDKAEHENRSAEAAEDMVHDKNGKNHVEYESQRNGIVFDGYDVAAGVFQHAATIKDLLVRKKYLDLNAMYLSKYSEFDGQGGLKTGLDMPDYDPNDAQSLTNAANWFTAKRGRKAMLDEQADKAKADLDPAQDKRFQQENQLRAQFDGLTASYRLVKDASQRVEAAAAQPSSAGDLSLIFNYMKVLDPGSTVREGEFATAEQATGVPNRILNMYNKILSGEKLSVPQRKDFVNQTKNLYKAQKLSFDQIQSKYSKIAQDNGLNVENVIGGFGESATPAAQPTPGPAADPIEQLKVNARGGDVEAQNYLKKIGVKY
jgi:hypothetical protein